jgi:mono/diheme cytochrome c family protein
VRKRLSLLAAVALVCAACGGDSERTPATPADAPAAAPAPASPAAPQSAPEGDLRGDATAGAQLYATYCASCHGADGKGDGPIAASLQPRPANHTDHAYMATLSDAQLYTVISKGGAAVGKSPLMAPWGGVVNEEGIRDLIAFIRKLSGT